MHIQVLGRVAVVHNDRPTAVSRAQARGVLAFLALNADRVVSLDQLESALWRGAEPPTARDQIYSAISSIRRLLSSAGGDNAIVGGRFGYQLCVDSTDVDALRFERVVQRFRGDEEHPEQTAARLREALTLWRGEPLADAAGAFVDAARARLTERRLTAIDDLATLDLAAGRFVEVAAELAPIVADHPSHERLRGRLMVALFRCGRQTDALRLYHEYRRSLAEVEGLDPGIDLAGIADAILRDRLPAVSRPRERRVTDASAPLPTQASVTVEPATYLPSDGTPNHLPAGVPDFVGRVAELATIAAAVWPKKEAFTPAIVTIAGMGGIGKTTLAVHAARRALDAFPGGCLYADLHGTALRPADPHVVIGAFLRALGVSPERVPSDPDEQLALYRSLTADRRLLIVVDDARDEPQLRPLIPTGRRCAMLATSRASLAGIDGATPIRLGHMSEADGARLLSAISDVTRGDAAEIARLCGGLPLALRIAGARLAFQNDTDPEGLHKSLADERVRLDQLSVGDRDVRATLALSCRRLSVPAATLFARLGALPVPEIPGWVATCLVDGVRSDGAGALRELTETALLTVNHMGYEPRYRLHDLVQLYAQELAAATHTPASLDNALRRVYEALAGLVVGHDERMHSGFPTPQPDENWYQASAAVVASDPTGWFATERFLIFGAIGDAHERGWTRLAAQLLTSATNLADMCSGPDEWTRLVELLLPAVKGKAGMEYEEATLLLGHGGRLRLRGDNEQALGMLRRARNLFDRVDDPARAATSATQMAVIYRRRGHPGPAKVFFEWAIARFAVAGHPPQEVQAHIGLGNLFIKAGRSTDAQASYDRALTLVQRHGEATCAMYPNVVGCIAEVLAVDGRHAEALERYHEAMASAAEIGDMKQWAQLQFQVALLHQRTDNRAATAQAARRAAQSLDDVGLTALAGRARKMVAGLEAGGPDPAASVAAVTVAPQPGSD
jgi:DNA-binding SARP family transcriptional activator/tetratricopeptide (TPR) repeat protein